MQEYKEEELLTTQEVAKILKVSEVSVKRYIAQDLIPSVKIGGTRRIIKNQVFEDFANYGNDKEDNLPEVSNGVQFYWSQKKAKIAQKIYTENCKEGSIIFDPFLGAGSSLYGTRSLNYKFVGTDINELPYQIAQFNTQNIDSELIKSLRNTLSDLKSDFGEAYFYEIKGKKLELIKVIYDNKDNPEIKNIQLRDTEGNNFESKDFPQINHLYLERRKEFEEKIKSLENPLLDKNSRIAIKENMFLADIFSPFAFYVLSKIKIQITDNQNFKFILSSILQLCKLTDVKSQSQFPFWIPKKDIVDRNIFITLENKIKSLEKHIGQTAIKQVQNFKKLKNQISNACFLLNMPVQNITDEIPDNSIDFVLTDPPYFDQVAYSEYLKIWEFFLGYQANFKDEIIVSQRKVEESNEELYLKNLEKAFEVVCQKMKVEAKIFIYFKDSRPDKMALFLKVLEKVGFHFIEQSYLDNAKFTYKQNTSQKTTLKGDTMLKLVKLKQKIQVEEKEKLTPETAKRLLHYFAKTYLSIHEKASLNELLSNGLTKLLYDYQGLEVLQKSKQVVKILEEIALYDEEKRNFSLKEKSWQNQLFLGNSLEILKKIPSNSLDACITDPPYNISGYDHKKKIGWLQSNEYWKVKKAFKKIDEKWDSFADDDYDNFTLEWLTEIKRIVKPNGNIALFGSYHNIYKIGYFLEKLDLKVINSIVWYKRNAFPNITQRMFCESTEHIIWATNNSKKKAKNWTFNYQTMKELNGGKQMRNLFDVPITKSSERKHGKHPSQKPLEVLENLVLALSNEGDTILDCFLGSGTTALASAKHKRNFLGIDESFEYLQIAERRLSDIDLSTLSIPQKVDKKNTTLFG